MKGRCVCSFTWVLFKRGQLGQHFEGDDVPGYALYTATWGLIVPGLLERYPGNRKMAVQVRSPAPAQRSADERHALQRLAGQGCPCPCKLAMHILDAQTMLPSRW